MVENLIFDDKRVLKKISIPRLKEICPNDKCYYSDKTFYLIYKNNDKVFPNPSEIERYFSEKRRKIYIKCYIGREDTLVIINKLLCHNIKRRKDFANLVEELSLLHDTKNKRIQDVVIEFDKIEAIYEKYNDILKPNNILYKFCYYWITLCIALDFREIDGKPTVIHRSLIVKDGIAYLREQIRREDFGNSWNDVIERVGPTKTVTDINYYPVKEYERISSGKKISVERHGRLSVTTEEYESDKI